MRFKTVPMKHQESALAVQRGRESFASFLEQGLGKTKVDLDDTADWFRRGRISTLIVVAPNGVHLAWRGQIEIHLPDDVPRVVLSWRGGLSRKDEDIWCRSRDRKLTVILMNVEALSTSTRAKDLVWSAAGPFAKITIDESTRIKHPTTARTKFLLKVGRRCAVRRILTGTPVTQSPFDLYSQFLFLDPKILGFSSYHSFCARYAEYVTEQAFRRGRKVVDPKTGELVDAEKWKYQKLVRYRRMSELSDLIQPHCVRYRKEDCLDLPEKIYKTIPVQLTKEQRKLYSSMDKDGIAEFDSFEVLAPTRLSRLTKMQQIVSGFLYDESGNAIRIEGENPKIEALKSVVEDHPGKTIVVARFRHEIELIQEALFALNAGKVMTMHGGVPAQQRRDNQDRFQNDPEARFYVAMESTLIGWNLTAAETMIYFTNEFSYEARYQSEDRAHRIGQTRHVVYVDLVGERTVDERVLSVLNECRKNAELVIDRKEAKFDLKNDVRSILVPKERNALEEKNLPIRSESLWEQAMKNI